jgi:hypothetical protein
MKLPDYVKCVIANKVTLAGYGLILTGIPIAIQQANNLSRANYAATTYGALAPSAGISLLIVTTLGRQTLRAYRRTKKYLQKHDEINLKIEEKYSDYCTRAGMKLAEREVNLEKMLEPIPSATLDNL